MRLTLPLLLCAVIFVPLIRAQSTTGAITGTVSDPSGAGLPSAKLTATEERTRLPYETVSDAQGGYVFPALRSGIYRLEAEAGGFRKLVRNSVEVRVNDRLQIDLAMALGAVTETVEVTNS